MKIKITASCIIEVTPEFKDFFCRNKEVAMEQLVDFSCAKKNNFKLEITDEV